MKLTYNISLSLTAISTVLSTPTARDLGLPQTEQQQDVYYLTVSSKKLGLFHNRPVVSLPDATIDGLQPLHLPPAFGTENFTIHPPSQPVLFTLAKAKTNAYALRAQAENAWISQYILRGKDVIAMGVPGQAGCPTPKLVNCLWDDWEFGGAGSSLKPRGKKGEWDAVKTIGGKGWRVVWKEGGAQHPVWLTANVWPGDKHQ